MKNETMQSDFPNDIARSNHILKKQIYGIELSQVSLDRTSKKLFGEDRNIKIVPDYINKLKGIKNGFYDKLQNDPERLEYLLGSGDEYLRGISRDQTRILTCKIVGAICL